MKSTRKIIFKNLILLAVVIICVCLVGFAWFVTKTDAEANGLSVKADSGLGLEASFDDGKESPYNTKLEKYVNTLYPLITGDGQDFFIPKLNLTIGEPITEDGSWVSKKDPVANQDYYEQDIWFRSTQEMELFLRSGDSSVTSDNIKNQIAGETFANKSQFGDFTRDFIAGASRVSFSEVTTDADGNETESLKYIWIPNEEYELLGSSEFVPLDRNTDGEGTEGGISEDPDETFGLTDSQKYISVKDPNYTGKQYHLSEAYKPQGADTFTTQFKHMYQSLEDGLIYGTIDISTTNYVDHAFDITDSAKLSTSNTTLEYNKDSSNTCPLSNYTYNGTTYTWIEAYFADKYNYGELQWAKLVINAIPDSNTFFTDIDRFQVLVKYNPDDETIKVVGFVFYNSETGIGSAGQRPVTYYSYSVDNGKQVIVTGVANNKTYALCDKNGQVSTTEVTVTGDNITSLDSNAMFTVEKNETVTPNTYCLKSVATDKCLYVDSSNKLTLSANNKTAFTLEAAKSSSSSNIIPVLKSGSLYLSFDTNGNFSMASTVYGEQNIYEGSTYGLNPSGSPESAYFYYDKDTNELKQLAADKYYLSSNLENAPAIATFKKDADSDYYKARIRIRVWAEGTDREAKIPLAGGTFNTILAFQGKPITTANS